MSGHFTLTELEGAAVQAALDRLSARSMMRTSLNGLLNKWNVFVSEIERGYNDNIYEYTNSLSVRDLVDEVCANVPKSAGEVILNVFLPIDRRYENATRPSSKPLAPGVDEGSPRWYRIPNLLLDELKRDIESEMSE